MYRACARDVTNLGAKTYRSFRLAEATLQDYKAKLKSLKDKTDKLYFRIRETEDLPQAIEELRSSLNVSTTILRSITDIFNVTDEERDRAVKVICNFYLCV